MFRACRWTQAWSTGRPRVRVDAPDGTPKWELQVLSTPRARRCSEQHRRQWSSGSLNPLALQQSLGPGRANADLSVIAGKMVDRS